MNRKFFQEYFNFSTREKKGLISLFIILLALIAINLYVSNQKKQERIDFSEFEKEIDRFALPKFEETQEVILFEFDPNTATIEELEKLGLQDNVVNNIIRYRNNGGRFFNKQSLSRIYGLCDDEFNRIKDFIVINNQTSSPAVTQKKGDFSTTGERFFFDPNSVTEQDLLRLGLTARQTNNLINYRKSGGLFHKPEDIKKIYGINEKIYGELKDFIVIKEPEIKTPEKDFVPQTSTVLVEINSADQNELQKINGIGPVYSERIIDYRERIGGFYEKNQLTEVWGIDQELISDISPQIQIDLNNIRTINLNEAEYRDLIRHPYIDRRTTNSLMEYKRFAGTINNIDELWQQRVIEKELFDKIKWYLKVYED